MENPQQNEWSSVVGLLLMVLKYITCFLMSVTRSVNYGQFSMTISTEASCRWFLFLFHTHDATFWHRRKWRLPDADSAGTVFSIIFCCSRLVVWSYLRLFYSEVHLCTCLKKVSAILCVTSKTGRLWPL